MRVTVSVDSATPREVYNLTLAFQRTRKMGLPTNLTPRHGEEPAPTVTVGGTAMSWTSPHLYRAHAEKLLAEFRDLQTLDAHNSVVSA